MLAVAGSNRTYQNQTSSQSAILGTWGNSQANLADKHIFIPESNTISSLGNFLQISALKGNNLTWSQSSHHMSKDTFQSEGLGPKMLYIEASFLDIFLE